MATFNSPVRKGNPELLNPLPEGVAGRASVPPCAGEIRRPKAEIRKKSEGRNPRQTARSRSPLHTFGLRLSGFFRISAFGFRIWRLLHVAASVVFLVQQLVNNAAAADAQSSAREAFERAKTEYDAHPADPDAAWKFARATFDLADAVPTNSERASVAEQGIAVSKQALQRASNSAPVHYYLGLNLAQLARTKTFGALSIVNQMEAEFTRAIELDPSFDYAGAERSLGLLYRDAPALLSIGSKSKARAQLQRAVDLAPGYPENRLNLIESELKWGDRKGARRELKLLENGWAAAKSQFSGPEWSASWADWESRLDKVKKALEEPARLESPHH
ncbi:MAG TPA: TRAP transporter TatT component family protein [Verrucomicrobiae bacterium]|nr:TRAP transporter TatT component family protein [Verrucomicrobiae bacterium]